MQEFSIEIPDKDADKIHSGTLAFCPFTTPKFGDYPLYFTFIQKSMRSHSWQRSEYIEQDVY